MPDADAISVSIQSIRECMTIVGNSFPSLRTDPARQFLVWFMWFNFQWHRSEEAISTTPPTDILGFITDNANDKSIDAFHFDSDQHIVYAIQSKYSATWTPPSRSEFSEIRRSADVLSYFTSRDNNNEIYQFANEKCRRLIARAFNLIDREGYTLVTLHITNKDEPSGRIIREVGVVSAVELSEDNFKIVTQKKLLALNSEFMEGHSPPIPPIFLPVTDNCDIHVTDEDDNLKADIGVCKISDIVAFYNTYGRRIFEKNIRGFKGTTDVNKDIANTLTRNPSLFLFRNSGVTILGKNVIRRSNPTGFYIEDMQIINGQQTVRTAGRIPCDTALIQIIIISQIGDTAPSRTRVDTLLSIIRGRNFQNRVGYADLKSNDPLQVTLWHRFREIGYYYQRKRETWKDMDIYSKNLYPKTLNCPRYSLIEKEKLAQMIIAIVEDPQSAYKGSDALFQDYYRVIFPRELKNREWYLAVYLLSKKYVYAEGYQRDDKYPQWHILNMLVGKLRLTEDRAQKFIPILEGQQRVTSLVRLISILYDLTNKYVQRTCQSEQSELSSNDIFGKRRNVLRGLKNLFNSRTFARKRHTFERHLSTFSTLLDEQE